MAIAFVQKASVTGAGATVTTASLSVTAGNLIVMCSSCYTDFVSAQDSYDSDTAAYTLDVQLNYAHISHRANFPSTGSYTFSQTANFGFQSMSVVEFSGCATTSPLDKTTSNEDFSATAHSSGTTAALAQSDEVAIGIGSIPTASTNTVDAWTELHDIEYNANYIGLLSAYNIVSDGAAQTFAWTSSASFNSNTVAATYKAAAGAITGGKRLDAILAEGLYLGAGHA